MRRALPVLAVACVYVDEDDGRLDQDVDGFPVQVDCNDHAPAVSVLEAWDGPLACGDRVTADLAVGADRLRIANCIHPVQRDDLAVLGEVEHVYRFSAGDATDVEVSLETDGLLLHVDERDTTGIALLVNRGSACELETCEIALPLAPEEYRSAVELSSRPPWRPAVAFHADAGEGWFVVVSGGRGGEPSPYTLDVVCPP